MSKHKRFLYFMTAYLFAFTLLCMSGCGQNNSAKVPDPAPVTESYEENLNAELDKLIGTWESADGSRIMTLDPDIKTTQRDRFSLSDKGNVFMINDDGSFYSLYAFDENTLLSTYYADANASPSMLDDTEWKRVVDPTDAPADDPLAGLKGFLGQWHPDGDTSKMLTLSLTGDGKIDSREKTASGVSHGMQYQYTYADDLLTLYSGEKAIAEIRLIDQNHMEYKKFSPSTGEETTTIYIHVVH